MPKKNQRSSEREQELEKQIGELNAALLRERADAINISRRAAEEKQKLGSFYKGLVVKELLPVIDNFERSLKHVPKELEDNQYVKGVNGVVKQFEATLEKLGVTRIKTVGEVFDPNLHEAASMEEGEGDVETIIEELQSGWTLDNEVLRHAVVRVKS